MTIQHDMAQTTARNAEQARWQRLAAALLGKLLELAAKEHLPAINWTVVNAGATLHGDCIAYPSQPLRREYFTAWRDAITAATGAGSGHQRRDHDGSWRDQTGRPLGAAPRSPHQRAAQ
jgi:hypothetical protein